MADREGIALISHLMRRAGFGASRDEVEQLCEKGYEDTVEQLLNPTAPPVDEYSLYRHHPFLEGGAGNPAPGQAAWLYFMVTTRRPLEEKMVLFWHHVFATGIVKVENSNEVMNQIAMFREHGMGSYRDLIVGLARDPAMIFYLDNYENHKNAPNENWGRELLELFSLGVGNYTETDVLECSRAFTGWTADFKIPRGFWGRFPQKFVFRPEDHDFTEKTFLGHTGNFDGEDIIDIILKQDACSRFISRHLYNFFVADEPQVPAWNIEEPRDPEAIEMMSKTLVDNDYQIKPVLRAMFNSDFFKEAVYQKIKSPAEVVVGTLRSTGDLTGPHPKLEDLCLQFGYMGQDILEPPSVEGWHTGQEWITSGSLVKRINFVADRMSDQSLDGVQRMIEHVGSNGATMTAKELVDRCLDIMGPVEASDLTRTELVANVADIGDIKLGTEEFSRRTSETFALIAATREYQFV